MSARETSYRSALDAYAGATSGELLDSRLVRARVLQGTRAPRRRSLRPVSFVLPLAAAFVASAAMAASHPAVRSAVVVHFAAMFGHAPALSRPTAAAPLRSAQPTVAESLSPAPVSSLRQNPEPVSPIAVDDLPLAPPPTSAPGNPLTSAGASRAVQRDAQLEAYRAAHRVHFDSGDVQAALLAWDSYLNEFPSGSFDDDARFNRGLCLIRLGRLSAARAALSPFAGAPAGSYRQVEAASLLQGLDAGGANPHR